MTDPVSAPHAEPNGGFPEPPPGASVRVVAARHAACGAETRVRLLDAVPARVVRRVVCQACAQTYEAPTVEDFGIEGEITGAAATPLAPAATPLAAAAASPPAAALPGAHAPAGRPRRPEHPVRRWLSDPGSFAWKWISIPIAAAAVIFGLVLIQRADNPSLGLPEGADVPSVEGVAPTGELTDPSTAGIPQQDGSRSGAEAAGNQSGGGTADANPATAGAASFVSGSNYSLALPEGWKRTNPQSGATFAAVAPNDEADATLWITRAPDLDFAAFEARSLDQLQGLAGSAQVVDRLQAPDPEDAVVTLAADAPSGGPSYEVTLRTNGPYRYYLATSVEPDASAAAAKGAELIHGSFVPVSGAAK